MPSPRRLRLLFVGTLVAVVLILLYTSGLDKGARDTRTVQDFYRKTVDGMGCAQPPGRAVMDSRTGARAGHVPADKDADGDVDGDDARVAAETKQRLRAAEQEAKDKANVKALRPDPPSQLVDVGNAAGQAKASSEARAAPAGNEAAKAKEVDEELNRILAKSPVIIFSKTYCPYSKRAKGILLEKYAIKPDPYVVELDEHPIGRAIQEQLARKTGRKTVPNILVTGVSIGGTDELVELDNGDRLVAKMRDLGSGRVEVEERFSVQGPG